MRYPTLSHDWVSSFVTEVLIRVGIEQEVVDAFLEEHADNDSELDLTEVARVGAELSAAASETGVTDDRLEPLENRFAGFVYRAFSDLPLEALGDVRFWSYCSARFFWRFVVLRQQESVLRARRSLSRGLLEPGSDDHEPVLPLNRYVLGKDHYQIPLRLFLRAQAVRGDQDFLDRNALEEGTDFWRSHILAVRTGSYPNWTRSLVAAQAKERLKIEEQRPPARAINRLRWNISPVLHDEEEAAAIINPLWKASARGAS